MRVEFKPQDFPDILHSKVFQAVAQTSHQIHALVKYSKDERMLSFSHVMDSAGASQITVTMGDQIDKMFNPCSL